MKTKILILGAGPAGLTFANRMKQFGMTDFLVLEKENEAGGLCRSVEVDDFPLDIGGGHFLDVKYPEVLNFLFEFMPEKEWIKYTRNSQIDLNGKLIGHPIEANIWQLNIDMQIEYLKSISTAGCNIGVEMPEKFTDWILWKFGSKLAEDYMIPYNQKMFGRELNQLGTYWMEKLPNVNFEQTLRSCLQKKAYGSQPGHTEFYYPKKFGYGEIWKRMSDNIKDNVHYCSIVDTIDFSDKSVMTKEGEKYSADIIITTIPWLEFRKKLGMPKIIQNSIKKLKVSSIQIEYCNRGLDTKAHWIYYPDLDLPYHRILLRSNFCPGSRGYWTETNLERINVENSNLNFKYKNLYAYPLNTIQKPEIMRKLLAWSEEHGVIGLGRWGEHQHYNSDVTVNLALKLAGTIINII